MGKKARDLAALAGLAGLAYAYNKNKGDSSTTDSKSGETTSSKKDADDNDTLARANREESSGLSTTKNSVVSAITSPKAASNDKAGNQGVIPPKSSTEVKPKPAAKPVSATPVYMSKTPGGNEKRTEGKKPMPSLKAVEARAASNKTDAMRNASRKAAAALKSKTPVAPKPTTRSPNILEEAKEEARRRAAASQATSTSSSTSPVTRTPFPGSSALNKKHGGAVKMASGGMAASRRADGIAQRGKTRGKMC